MAEIPNMWSWIPSIPYIPYWMLLIGYLITTILIGILIYRLIDHLLEEE